jgi:anti-anti-sigma regulatory factor
MEDGMLTLRVENFTDLAVVECKGRIVHSDDVFKLRDIVQSQDAARVIVLDLSEVEAIGGGGLGMLALLEHWAGEQDIRLELFCLSESVVKGLAQTRSLPRFEIASFQGMMDLLTQFNRQDDQCTLAA